ncbi:TonB-dependent siderophore myxochelin receptor MxcH [Sorangium sp. So ce861]|uniref:TonB-dependent siderophore myxochelin receptor MxcH n=1 Tax=Sorangium sp. So ce861 TaxID=3133323 RepID=UPI003F626D80
MSLIAVWRALSRLRGGVWRPFSSLGAASGLCVLAPGAALAQPTSGEAPRAPPEAQAAEVEAPAPVERSGEEGLSGSAERRGDGAGDPAPRADGQPAAAPPAAAPAAPIEVSVRGESAGERLKRSAEAVSVVDLGASRRESADLGEVLARQQGVAVRRSGGLGSSSRFSLNGLHDEQIRFFLDGIPLDLAGFGLGIANVPVHLVERVDVYRGVVPIRFGADALGGAVNLVTDTNYRGTHGSGSYEVGSFGTYRAALSARHRDEPSGLVASASAFHDYAKNDYPIHVEVGGARGSAERVTVHRFHDAYRAYGGAIELGWVDRPWAKRLLARVFATRHDKEIQHNPVMTAPYGEARYGETSVGGTLRYEHPNLFRSRRAPLRLAALASYGRESLRFEDRGQWQSYDWYGRLDVRPGNPAGEIDATAADQSLWRHRALARLSFELPATSALTLRLALTPTLEARTGEDRTLRQPGDRDPLSADRRLLKLVSGLEIELDLLGGRLENIAFLKQYAAALRSEEAAPREGLRRHGRSLLRAGAGDALRLRLTDWLSAKASYELATRLPTAEELFGDGVLVLPNVDLEPETSHNGNLSLSADAKETPAGALRAEVNGFFRHADGLIAPLAGSKAVRHDNVVTARALGVEGAFGWTSPGGHVALDGSVTWQDLRNLSREGAYRSFRGDRLPNRPWLFASGSARLQVTGVAARDDELSLGLTTRYVHEFFRLWESDGFPEFEPVIPAQLTHALAISYVARAAATVTSTIEVQNLTDARAYDFFGVERPGRAFFFKGLVDY